MWMWKQHEEERIEGVLSNSRASKLMALLEQRAVHTSKIDQILREFNNHTF
jgi:hypothetical protein